MNYVGFECKLSGAIYGVDNKGNIDVVGGLNIYNRKLIREDNTIIDKLKNWRLSWKLNATIFKVNVSELTPFEVIDSLGRRSGVCKTICFKNALEGTKGEGVRTYVVTHQYAHGNSKSIVFDDGRVMIKGIGDFELSDFYEISFD